MSIPPLLTAIIAAVLTQSVSSGWAEVVAEPVLLMRQVGQMPTDWYKDQVRVWRQRVTEDATQASAWYNLVLATEYGFRGAPDASTGDAELARLIRKMEEAVPGTYEVVYLKSRNTPHSDRAARRVLLERANRLCPGCPEALAELAFLAGSQGRQQEAVRLYTALYRLDDIAAGLLDYNYNLLMSTEEDAILFTNGDNDTFPALMLQQAKGIRPDVLILNLWVADDDRDFLLRTLRNRGIELSAGDLPAAGEHAALLAYLCGVAADAGYPVSVALSVAASSRQGLEERLYMSGLAYTYSPSPLDSAALLKRNLENFRLDYLSYDWYSENHPSTVPVVHRLDGNYCYPFLHHAAHLRADDRQEHAAYWQQLAVAVAERSGNRLLVDEISKRIDGGS